MTEYSYNGWSASRNPRDLGVVPLVVNGVEFVGGVRGGDTHTIHEYFWTQFDKRVERLRNPGCWGWSYRKNRNADNLSCHSSATATDGNAPAHPNGVPTSRTFSPVQIAEVHKILAELDGVLVWGGDFRGTPDSMHVENHGTAAQVAAVARKITSQKDWFEMATKKDLQDVVEAAVKPLREAVADLRTQNISLYNEVGKLKGALGRVDHDASVEGDLTGADYQAKK